MSKKIGIPGWVIDNKVFGVTLPYAEFIRPLGKIIILSPEEVREDLDLLLLPGGADIFLPNDTISFYQGNHNSMLEYFDANSLPSYIDNGTPIFGICRGAQRLFTHFGGGMNQHNFVHTQSSHPKDECHQLEFSKKYKHLDNSVNSVNSRHHQMMETPSNDIEVIAYATNVFKKGNITEYITDYNIIEAFKIKDLPIAGTQYHPEDCVTENLSYYIIHNFLNKQYTL